MNIFGLASCAVFVLFLGSLDVNAETQGSPPTHAIGERAAVQIKDFIYWGQIGFDTHFPNAHSEDYSTPDLPAGWVVCQELVGSAGVGRGAGWSYTFFDPMPNDSQVPARKKAIVYHLTAPASHDVWDQWGSNVWLHTVGIRAISESATVQQRWDFGCRMDH